MLLWSPCIIDRKCCDFHSKRKPINFELVWPCCLEKQCTQIRIFSFFLFLRIFNSVFNAPEINLMLFGENTPAPSALFSFCTNTSWNLTKVGGLPSITRVCCSPREAALDAGDIVSASHGPLSQAAGVLGGEIKAASPVSQMESSE